MQASIGSYVEMIQNRALIKIIVMYEMKIYEQSHRVNYNQCNPQTLAVFSKCIQYVWWAQSNLPLLRPIPQLVILHLRHLHHQHLP